MPPADPPPTDWSAWPARRLLLFITLVIMGDMLAQALVYGASRELFLAVLAGSLLGVVLPCALLARGTDRSLWRAFHLDRLDLGAGLAALAGAGAALVPTSVLAGLSTRLHPIDPEWLAFTTEHLPSSGLGVALAAVTAVVAAPLAEELLFRGLVYRLARRTWGPWPAAIVSSLAFGLVHSEPWYLFGLIGLGLVLAALYECTGTLLAPLIGHALHNAISLTLMLRHPEQLAEETTLAALDWLLLAASVGALAAIFWLLRRRTRRLAPDLPPHPTP